MKQSTWLTGVALLSIISFTLPGCSAYIPQGPQTFPYPKAFMLHRRTKGSKCWAGGMPNLSVVGPLDVLRQKMILDMMEQRMKNKINANNEFLSRLGKRGGPVTASTPTILDLSNTAAIDTFQQEWLDSLGSTEV
ncbi:uncharacterized protein LOC111262624 isoform X1 [Varroa jacobsoni]|uniref:uncharacterized protein LOC111262624 isoform X1 n=1 Tax=Varroa jacobsoni TaxID=62625 RepID=UPI000BF4E4CC|nr:uncharacterized protein LOC111262624 isoform X1 [Varroa jacobsoni]XP_022692752.1 uncharacterized protein LOC111262624 isoform X1 [Varroa jacobsoni]XP_022692753.1 uncharacterized protein LOC111262624 isoform X1 [Varroa jacobsoni]